MGTEQFAGQKIGMIADTLSVLHILASPAKYSISLLPQFFGNDSRYDFSRFILEHDPFFRREEFLLFGEHIHHLDLVAHIVALVFRIGNHARHGGVGYFLAVVVTVSLFPEQCFKLFHGVFIGGIQFKQLPNHHSLIFIYNQTAIIFDISKDTAVAQHYILLDGLLMPKFHTGGQLAEFILCDGGHDGQAKFRVLIKGIDVVVLEKNADSRIQQLSGILDGVQRIASKTGDFLCDNKIKFTGFCIIHHAIEILTAFGGNTGQSLVNISRHECPRSVLPDEILVITDLVAQRVQLLIRF